MPLLKITLILYETGNTQIAIDPALMSNWLIWDIAKIATGSYIRICAMDAENFNCSLVFY